jgi:hypothetical protein
MKKYWNMLTTEFINLLKHVACLLGFHAYLTKRTPIENTMYSTVILTCVNCGDKKEWIEHK